MAGEGIQDDAFPQPEPVESAYQAPQRWPAPSGAHPASAAALRPLEVEDTVAVIVGVAGIADRTRAIVGLIVSCGGGAVTGRACERLAAHNLPHTNSRRCNVLTL